MVEKLNEIRQLASSLIQAIDSLPIENMERDRLRARAKEAIEEGAALAIYAVSTEKAF